MYKANVSYMYGSRKPTTSTTTLISGLKGNTESAVQAYLRERHKNVKDLQILIKSIEWK